MEPTQWGALKVCNDLMISVLMGIISHMKSPAHADNPNYQSAVHRLTLVVMLLQGDEDGSDREGCG